MKKLLALGILLLTVTVGRAQAPQISGSFQLDAQYYNADEGIGITADDINGKTMGINGYGNLLYTLGNFSAGIRFEACLTPLSGFDARMEGVGLANYWAKYDNGTIGVTVGDFYEQFGSGLVLRTYEEWSLGFDNSLRGMRVVYRPTKSVTLKGVYGSQRLYWEERDKTRGIVRGIDGEWNLNDAIASLESSKLRVTLGASAVSKYQDDDNSQYVLPENVAAYAGRVNVGLGKVNFMTEYAYKFNDPSAINNFIYKEGQGLLSSISYSKKGLGVVAQFKRIDNMSFKSSRNAKSNDLDINFIPPLCRTHTYNLPAMYSYSSQPNGEMSWQFQINYTIPKKTLLGGKYGAKVAVNYSQVNDIEHNYVESANISGTMGYTSNFFAISDHKFYRDFNVEFDKKLSKKWKFYASYVNLYYDIATIEGHSEMNAVQSHVGIVDLTYKFNSKNSLRIEMQSLWDTGDYSGISAGESENYIKSGNWVSAMLEYTIAPKWFFSVADKYNYGNPFEDYRDHYYNVSMGYIQDATRIAITAGRQSKGVVCVGGVCRPVPASSGILLTVTTNF